MQKNWKYQKDVIELCGKAVAAAAFVLIYCPLSFGYCNNVYNKELAFD